MESGVPSPAFPAVLRNGAPITREYSGYLELAPHAVKRKNGESGSDNLGTGNRFQNSLTSIPDLGGGLCAAHFSVCWKMAPATGPVLAGSGLQCAPGSFSHLPLLLFGETEPTRLAVVLHRVIDVRKRFIVRNGHAQECAERLPPLLDLKDQQPLRGDRLLHLEIVLSKDSLAMRAIGQSTAKGAGGDDVPIHRCGPFGKDRGLDAVVPALRITDG